MPDPYEPADAQALTDVLSASRDFARMIRGQYEGYLEAGFNETQAMRLVAAYVGSVSNA